MSSTIIPTNLPGPLDEIELKPLSPKQKKLIKPLITPGVKYVLASKLNNLTGGKFKCLRNWQESSGQALFQKIKDTMEPTIRTGIAQIKADVPGTLDGIKTASKEWVVDKAPAFLQGVVNSGVESVFEHCGLNQSVEVCKNFVSTTCNLLLQTDGTGQPQTVDRLLTIVGVTYNGNEDVKAIVDKTLASISKEFFEGILPKILSAKLGKFAGVAEKFVATLGVKNTVDNFLKERILEKQNPGEILSKGDVYEKLILKGTSIFVENRGSKDLNLDELLKDENLDESLRIQLNDLQKLYSASKLTKFAMSAENSLVPHVLSELKDKDILHMSNEDLKRVFANAGKAYVSEIGDRLVTTVKDYATSVGNAVVDTTKTALQMVGNGAKYIGNVVRNIRESVVDGWKNFWGGTSNSQDPIPEAEAKSKEAANSGIVASPAEKKSQITTNVSEEKELEDDFGEYLQALFSEKGEIEPSQRSVEQNSEQSSGVGGAILNGAAAVGNAVWNGATAVAPVVGNAALKTAEVGGKVVWEGAKLAAKGVAVAAPVVGNVAWEGAKLLGNGVWGLGKLAGNGIAGVYNWATGSSSEAEPEKADTASKNVETQNPTLVAEKNPENAAEIENISSEAKPEIVAPVAKSEEKPIPEDEVISAEVEDAPKESPAVKSPEMESSPEKTEDNRWFFQRWFGW